MILYVLPLELSSRHFIFLREQQEYPVLSSSLKIGDVLLGENHEPLKITKIEHVKSKGIFSPFTADGNIVVNDVVCSIYTFELGDGVESDYVRLGGYNIMTMQTFAHMMCCSPLRLAALGISPWFGTLADAEGASYYIVLILKTYGWAMSTNPVIKTVGIAMYYVLFGAILASFAAELMVGATMGPASLLVVFIATVRLFRLKNGYQKVDHVLDDYQAEKKAKRSQQTRADIRYSCVVLAS